MHRPYSTYNPKRRSTSTRGLIKIVLAILSSTITKILSILKLVVRINLVIICFTNFLDKEDIKEDII